MHLNKVADLNQGVAHSVIPWWRAKLSAAAAVLATDSPPRCSCSVLVHPAPNATLPVLMAVYYARTAYSGHLNDVTNGLISQRWASCVNFLPLWMTQQAYSNTIASLV